ncbi:PREDICTED: transmembrane protease serine 9-like [Nicrophorus vespilloides]|uniref:Transmembrane protease serine 9-like n=1 Tax=Nicrophorus vespilloides TaxID=110193 RepID=A0ABM1M4F0_NICVS|nr:PREDICTED: transmembrane protease serine 9-like [Nicrophorus vespilloides]
MVNSIDMSVNYFILACLLTVATAGEFYRQDTRIYDNAGRIPSGRIVGGEQTTIQEFPYQVSVEYFHSHMCGGAILDENTVITAAHCTDGYGSLTVRAGTTTSNVGGVKIDVAEVRQHEEYNPMSVNNDVSILKLAKPLQFKESISPINLPKSTEDLPSGTKVVVTGWGVTFEGGSVAEKFLRKVELYSLSNDECRAINGGMITPEMICAGIEEGGKDACQGDSGGPMAADGTLYGIVSWGLGCARPRYPGVYANVAKLLPWIEANRHNEMNRVSLRSAAQQMAVIQLSILMIFAPLTETVIKGKVAVIDENPYQVSVFWHSKIIGSGIIVGNISIISVSSLFVERKNDLRIRAGSSIYSEGGQLVEVETVIPHERYNAFTQDYDIAILKLKYPLKYNERINPVKLPEDDFYPAPGTNVFVSGWGVTDENSETPEKVLRGAEVMIINHDICKNKYKHRNEITDRMICASSPARADACQGDSGGPLVYGKTLVGVVSFGIGCADPNFPGIYANVKELLPWIKQHMHGSLKVLDPVRNNERHIMLNPWVYIPVASTCLLLIIIIIIIVCYCKRSRKETIAISKEEYPLNDLPAKYKSSL